MRKRAKEHFPTVLLTLLSIVQALALELLWSHLNESTYLFHPSWIMAISWLQILATFFGLILIWVVYASNVMRFRWVPVTSDSVYPFIIGITEFMLIESLGPEGFGIWMLLMALIFGMMTLVSHANMRRARQDPDNQAFFSAYEPAELKDFYPQIAIVFALVLSGLYFWISSNLGWAALIAALATNAFVAWQFHASAQYWKQTVTEVPDT